MREKCAIVEYRTKHDRLKNLRTYIVKQMEYRRILHVGLGCVFEILRLLSNATNCMNPIARCVNETGACMQPPLTIYADDMMNCGWFSAAAVRTVRR
jgi:uncharacterized UPF0146 family protein